MATMNSTTLISTAYDLPAPMVMTLSRAPNQKPSGIDWSDFTAQPFQAFADVLKAYRHSHQSLATALRYLVEFVLHVQQNVYSEQQFESDNPYDPWLDNCESDHPDYLCLDFSLQYMLALSRNELELCADTAILGFDQFLAVSKKKSCLHGIHDFITKHTKPCDISVDPQGSASWGPSDSCDVTANLEAFECILSCVWHPGVTLTDTLQENLGAYRETQPAFTQGKEDQYSSLAQRELRSTGSFGTWPALTQALASFMTPGDDDAIIDMVTEFLRITYRATEVSKLRTSMIVEEDFHRVVLQALCIEFSNTITNPLSQLLLRVRHVLNAIDLVGAYQFMRHFV